MTTPVTNRAFTLVETIIVVAVIGVIVAIAMPAYIRARETSRARTCQENLAQIDGAIDVYAIEKKKHTGDIVAMSNLISAEGTGYLRDEPKCPASGTYTVNKVDSPPTCSISDNTASPYAPHIIDRPLPFTP